MASVRSRPKFFESEQGEAIERRLQELVDSDHFNTESTYAPDTSKYPDNIMSFVEKHKLYIIAHPTLDATQYVDNIRLKTRLR